MNRIQQKEQQHQIEIQGLMEKVEVYEEKIAELENGMDVVSRQLEHERQTKPKEFQNGMGFSLFNL